MGSLVHPNTAFSYRTGIGSSKPGVPSHSSRIVSCRVGNRHQPFKKVQIFESDWCPPCNAMIACWNIVASISWSIYDSRASAPRRQKQTNSAQQVAAQPQWLEPRCAPHTMAVLVRIPRQFGGRSKDALTDYLRDLHQSMSLGSSQTIPSETLAEMDAANNDHAHERTPELQQAAVETTPKQKMYTSQRVDNCRRNDSNTCVYLRTIPSSPSAIRCHCSTQSSIDAALWMDVTHPRR